MEKLVQSGYRKSFIFRFAALLSFAIIFAACNTTPAESSSGSSGTAPKSADKAITAFNFTSPVSAGIINETNHTIAIRVPYGTPVTNIAPSISLTGATVSPASGVATNFTNPVIYTVTAADGSTQDYTVSVTTIPANVTALTATEGYAQVELSWTPPLDTNFAGVEITAVPAITTVTIFKGTNSAMISGLSNGTNYTFTVKSFDTSGKKSTGATVNSAPVSKFTVTYIGNDNTGGSVPVDSETYVPGATATVLANTGALIRVPAAGTAEAFKFGGWNDRADGSGTTYAAGSGTFTVTKNTKLYTKWVKFDLRDIGPAGGYIFYDKGTFSDGWRYLEAAPNDWGNGSHDVNDPLSCATYGYCLSGGYFLEVGGTRDGIGKGKTNTALMVARITTDTIAKKCADYSVQNGETVFKGWFLPSKEELTAMYENLKKDNNLGGFYEELPYWSSTEGNANFAYARLFKNNISSQAQNLLISKGNSYMIRFVRNF